MTGSECYMASSHIRADKTNSELPHIVIMREMCNAYYITVIISFK